MHNQGNTQNPNDEKLMSHVIKFVGMFLPVFKNDCYSIAEITYGVPESVIRKWYKDRSCSQA